MSNPSETNTYLFYNRKTGAILGTYSYYDAVTQQEQDQPQEEIQKMIPGLHGVQDPSEVEILKAEGHAKGTRWSGYHIDVHHKKLAPRHQLRIEPAKTTLLGDGQDTTKLAITVVDQKGEVVSDFDGELRVTTSRGKLSSRGGIVKAAQGKATITLTSVPETVHQVKVTVTDPSGRSVRSGARLAFE